MFSSTNQSRKAKQRGTAVTETMLIFVPALVFFSVIMLVLDFWQNEQIDYSWAMAGEIARFNSTESTRNNGSAGAMFGITTDKPEPQFYWENPSQKNRDGEHAKYTVYVSSKGPKTYRRRVMFIRGVNSWLSYGDMRCQREEEGKWAKQYLLDTYNLEKLISIRKPLQLGS